MKFSLLALSVASFSTAAFIKVESKTTINNDHSSKNAQVMELNLDGLMAMIPGGAGAAGNPMLKPENMLVEVMRAAKSSVDVWVDAKAEKTKLGATKIAITSLTKDWLAQGDVKKMIAQAGAVLPFNTKDLPEMKIMNSKDEGGKKVVTFLGVDEVMDVVDSLRGMAVKEGKGPKAGEMKVDEQQITAALAQAKPAYEQYKGMAAMLLKDISVTMEFTVSGTIVESSVFKQTGPNTVSMTFVGTQLIELADQVLNDEELPSKVVKLGKAMESGFKDGSMMPELKKFISPYMATVYGGHPNPRIVYTPGADAFDYPAEAAKATAGQSDSLKKLIEKASKPSQVTLPDDAGDEAAPKPKKKAA